MSFPSINPEEFGKIFQIGDFERIYRCTSDDFQHLVSLGQFQEMAGSFNKGVNRYQLEWQSFVQQASHYIWLDDRKEKAISVSFDRRQQIQSILIKPFITYPETDKHFTKLSYSMPIKGEWFVFWGGANELLNYHYPYESQRYAYDLVKMQEGSSYRDSQSSCENFYAYNEIITAPADGKVVFVSDGVNDNTPGEMDPKQPAGNYAVIQHAKREYSLLAHLKKDSILVKAGTRVKEGQPIGKCGNSGNSSEPHLHFQVMDSPDMEKGKSIRIRFKDGPEPIQGDTVSNFKEYNADEIDKFDKVENALTISELLLFIPRTIMHFFK